MVGGGLLLMKASMVVQRIEEVQIKDIIVYVTSVL